MSAMPCAQFDGDALYTYNSPMTLREQGFGVVLACLKLGGAATRAGWNGAGMAVFLQRPTSESKMTLPYIFMRTATGDLVPWLASQTDLLAEDWIVTYPAAKPRPEML